MVPLMARHLLNKRNYKVVRETYVLGILEKGGMQGVRGVPWYVMSPDGIRLLMSSATYAESFYEAYHREPENPFVQQTLKQGLRHGVSFIRARRVTY